MTSVLGQKFWHLGLKSAENLQASKCCLGVEFNTLVEDEVKPVKG